MVKRAHCLPWLLSFLVVMGCGGKRGGVALGTLERDRIAHTATANEVVVSLPVLPGTVVKKGTTLVQLDGTLQRAQVHKAKALVARAQANLDKLRHGARAEEIAAARAKVAGARAAAIESVANFERVSNLKKKNLVSQSELDVAQASRDARLASLESAQEEQLLLTNGAREEDLRAAEAELEEAKATLASEERRLADLTVVATRDGILDNLPWNLGERVRVGSPLAIVLAGKAPFARVYVPEPYRINLEVGDELVVHVDGVDRAITGKLRWISTDPAFSPYYALNQEERARLMYLAEVQLPDDEAHLANGIPAQVDLP